MKKENVAPVVEAAEVLDVACDDGHGGIKIAIYKSGELIKQLRINSRARAGIHGTTVVGHPSSAGDVAAVVPAYTTAGAQFTVGDFHDSEDARFQNYPFSDLNRVLIAHALRLAGLGGMKIRLTTGLPMARYFNGDKVDEAVVSRKDESIRIPVAAADGSEMAQIIEHRVLPEGLGAWIDFAVDAKGQMRDEVANSMTAVIDIGSGTTDTAVILPGMRIDHARSGSANIGVLDVIEAVKLRLSQEMKVDVPAFTVEKALVDRSIRLWGKSHDIGKIIDECAEDVLSRLMREINRRLGSAVDIDQIILVGGGAYVFSKAIDKHYPNITIAPEPEFANARGFAKYFMEV